MSKSVLIYGGYGALGKKCVEIFRNKNYKVTSIDMTSNPLAHDNIIVSHSDTLTQQSCDVLEKLSQGLKFDAVLCVAGGWAGGNAKNKDLATSVFTLEKQCIWTSVIATQIAARHLSDNGCLVLTGAKAAQGPTPSMLGYGIVKASVHQLTKSLAAPKSGLPPTSWVGAILPVTLDTEMNRKNMPNADFSSWTPMEYVANLLLQWTENLESRPGAGSLVELITENNETKLVIT